MMLGGSAASSGHNKTALKYSVQEHITKTAINSRVARGEENRFFIWAQPLQETKAHGESPHENLLFLGLKVAKIDSEKCLEISAGVRIGTFIRKYTKIDLRLI